MKLTKSELRAQQNRLMQLQRYLPTLQLKKAMLQAEVSNARLEIKNLDASFEERYAEVKTYIALYADTASINLSEAVQIDKVHKRYENIAGVEVPYFESVSFAHFTYSLFETPPWLDSAIVGLKSLIESQIQIEIAYEKRNALEKEFRDVSIRVNLFEKILIPRALKNIKRIKVFLADQQLAAVSQAKVAKTKIIEREQNEVFMNFAIEVTHAH